MVFMRYLGNKESLLPEINRLLVEQDLVNTDLSFFDAFCGSGSVSNFVKQFYKKLIVNDNLKWATFFTNGRIIADECTFDLLGFDPFQYFNESKNHVKGFFYQNYCPAMTNRMYFSEENASRIDFFRSQIEEWWVSKKITENEYQYLLSCLIESVSDVSNTAGVYGSFLKKWDSRALKPIFFDRVDSRISPSRNIVVQHNEKLENIIQDVECDILYLDPPYTQNQYGTQYHILETLVLDDNPTLSAITGSRSTRPMRSDWSKDYMCHILFDKVLAKTKAKYVIFSYNSTGFMSKTFIEASMKRYGMADTFVCKKIPYKKYKNWKSKNNEDYFEYLYFVQMKQKSDIIYESPLNYTGNKSKIIEKIIPLLPDDIDVFVDAFGGGFNVGVNVKSKKVIYNEINFFVKDLIESFKNYDTYQYLNFMKKTILKFNLEKENRLTYQTARDQYNSTPIKKRDPRFLFTLILYGFQQQIRFNGSHNFNNPVGLRWFNDKILEKMISFSRICKESEFEYLNEDFFSICDSYINSEDNHFYYLDPPYKLTTGAYNDGKRGFSGWNDKLELELLDFADKLTMNEKKFMLSYVLEHKGQKNLKLEQWIVDNNYTLTELGDVLGVSGSRRKEVLITNYMC